MQLPLGLGLKLGALVALILGAFSASWWFVHHELAAIERLYTRVVEVHDPALDAAYKMHLGHAAIGIAVRDALAGTTAVGAQRLAVAGEDFARNLALLEQLAEPALELRLRELATLHRAYLAQAERLIELGIARDTDLSTVVARLTRFKGVLVEALLPTALSTRDAAAMRDALDHLDDAVGSFALRPDGRHAWRVDEALKFFQRDLAPALAPDGTRPSRLRAARVRQAADEVDAGVRAAVQSTRALTAALEPFDEQARIIDYRLSTRFEPTTREAMRAATGAALDRIRVADRRAALLLAVAVLVGSVVGWVVLRHVLWPLRQLLLATRAVAAGDYRATPAIPGRDELARLGAAFARMARTLEQTTISRTLFDDVLHSLDEALFVTDRQGRIELANRAAAAMTGRAAPTLIGTDIATLIPHAPAAAGTRIPTTLTTTDGVLPVLAGCLPLAGDGASPRQVVTALDDSARRAAEQALARSHEELQRLHASLDRRLEDERATLARELHDELGASLTTMKTLVFLAASGRREVALVLQEIGAGIDDMSEATTRIVNGLRPPVLDHFGLVAALDWYVREFTTRTGLRCTATLPDDDPVLPADTALALFRAAQECLTNAQRHARARRIDVELRFDGNRLTLRITDDGIGCEPAALDSSERCGLRGLRERLRTIGATLNLDSAPGRGLRALIVAPAARLADAA